MSIKGWTTGAMIACATLATMPASAQTIVVGPGGVRIQEDGLQGRGSFEPRAWPRDGRDERPDRYGRRDRDDRGGWDYLRGSRRGEIDQRQAIGIARSLGVREVDTISLTARGWRIEGGDRRGRDIAVIVDWRDGNAYRIR